MGRALSLYWLIPFSSQVSKFKKIHASKAAKYGKCDTIIFGDILGYEKDFLIQNMCPVTKEYISCDYVDSIAKNPVRVDGVLQIEKNSCKPGTNRTTYYVGLIIEMILQLYV